MTTLSTCIKPDLHESSIIDKIENVSSLSELITIIKCMSNHIDLNHLKNVLKDTVIHAKSSDTTRMYYSMMNIETLLPIDIIQHIESFNNTPCIKFVSKKFKKCFDLNESQQLRQRESLIKTELNVTEENKIWHINDGDSYTLETAIQESNHGDTILINNGTYELEGNDNIFSNKCLKIIGNENVEIQFYIIEKSFMPLDYWEFCNSKIYFKNLRLSLLSSLKITKNSSLWIENCEVRSNDLGICIDETGNLLSVTNSVFPASTDYSHIWIGNGVQQRTISIVNCEFHDNNERMESMIELSHSGHSDSLKIVGNCFKTVDGYPFGKIPDDSNERDGMSYYIGYMDEFQQAPDRIIRSNCVYFTQDRILKYLC